MGEIRYEGTIEEDASFIVMHLRLSSHSDIDSLLTMLNDHAHLIGLEQAQIHVVSSSFEVQAKPLG